MLTREKQEQTKVSSFLTDLLPQVKAEVAINTAQLIEAGAIVFIAATLIFLSYFTFKKLMK